MHIAVVLLFVFPVVAGQASSRLEKWDCGDLNNKLMDCWGSEFIWEPPTCEEKSILVTCAEELQEEFNKCPSERSFREILDSTVQNYKRILSNLCSQPNLIEDFRVYNICWSLAAICSKSLSITVKGLIGPLSCRFAQESADLCLTALAIGFQGKALDPKQCLEPKLADKLVRLVYDSVDCNQSLNSRSCITRSVPNAVLMFIIAKQFAINIL